MQTKLILIDGLDRIENAVKESVKIFEFARIYEQLGVEELKYVEVEQTLNEAVALFSGLTFKVTSRLSWLEFVS